LLCGVKDTRTATRAAAVFVAAGDSDAALQKTRFDSENKKISSDGALVGQQALEIDPPQGYAQHTATFCSRTDDGG
jgi:hypothetical protein